MTPTQRCDLADARLDISKLTTYSAVTANWAYNERKPLVYAAARIMGTACQVIEDALREIKAQGETER